MTFAYGCCVGSWERFTKNVVPHVPDGSPLFSTPGNIGSRAIGIARAYNAILSIYPQYDDGTLEGLILLHDDLELTDPQAEEKFRRTLALPRVEVVGVAGGQGGISWWDHDPIGHQLTDTTLIDFGVREGDVRYLEGSVLVLSPWVIDNFSFDENFEHWHGYEEIATRVVESGRRAYVADVDTHHHTYPGRFRTPTSASEWVEADAYYHKKWGLA